MGNDSGNIYAGLKVHYLEVSKNKEGTKVGTEVPVP